MNEHSDLDILVDFSGRIGWKFFDLKLYLEQKLSLKVALVTKEALKKRLRASIIAQTEFIQ
jgi:predicted nucleotidyltransferase